MNDVVILETSDIKKAYIYIRKIFQKKRLRVTNNVV